MITGPNFEVSKFVFRFFNPYHPPAIVYRENGISKNRKLTKTQQCGCIAETFITLQALNQESFKK
jgi:hypothetical protein